MNERDSTWERLPTEAEHPASRDLDLLSSAELVALLVAEDRDGLARVAERAAELAALADRISTTLSGGGDVLFAGAGTSGRLGVLEAAECPPTFGLEPRRIRAVMAGGESAVFTAVEGAEDRREDGRAAAADLRAGDLLIAISASSVTPFVLGALAAAREHGAATALLTCVGGDELDAAAPLADHVLALDTGPEILTGSTRLKAGSATKAALNALTTAAMVRSGKVFGRWMVDVRPGSAKLVDRSVRIVAAAAGIERPAAAALLASADGEVKTAIVAARAGLPPEQARKRLLEAGGNVRKAIAGQ
jgi:N-acetylmuramic acid 6-phosphate etherase